jgi:hypothetical protein
LQYHIISCFSIAVNTVSGRPDALVAVVAAGDVWSASLRERALAAMSVVEAFGATRPEVRCALGREALAGVVGLADSWHTSDAAASDVGRRLAAADGGYEANPQPLAVGACSVGVPIPWRRRNPDGSVAAGDESPLAAALLGCPKRTNNEGQDEDQRASVFLPTLGGGVVISPLRRKGKGGGQNGGSRDPNPGELKHAPDTLPGFPDAVKADKKTGVQGGGGLRDRWVDRRGKIYEWDSRHGTVEQYSRTGKHLGEFGVDGQWLAGPVPGRRLWR